MCIMHTLSCSLSVLISDLLCDFCVLETVGVPGDASATSFIGGPGWMFSTICRKKSVTNKGVLTWYNGNTLDKHFISLTPLDHTKSFNSDACLAGV